MGTRITDEKFASSVLQVVQRTPATEAEIAHQRVLLQQINGAERIVELLERQ